jgi:DNA repair protein RadC
VTTSEAAAYHPIIRELPDDERPRERMRLRGASALTNPELLAILLRTGSRGENVVSLATRLLARFEGIEALSRVSFAELCGQKHVGPAKAAQILAALELGTRIMCTTPERKAIRCPEDIYSLFGPEMALLDQEHVRVVLLDTRSRVIAWRDVHVGNVHSAVVRVAEVFKEAVRAGCPSIIIVHNHPSGDPEPSPDDASLTTQLEEAGRLLGVDVTDHIVIGRNGLVSLRERGLGFSRK